MLSANIKNTMARGNSIIVFGGRGTGKSTIIKEAVSTPGVERFTFRVRVGVDLDWPARLQSESNELLVWIDVGQWIIEDRSVLNGLHALLIEHKHVLILETDWWWLKRDLRRSGGVASPIPLWLVSALPVAYVAVPGPSLADVQKAYDRIREEELAFTRDRWITMGIPSYLELDNATRLLMETYSWPGGFSEINLAIRSSIKAVLAKQVSSFDAAIGAYMPLAGRSEASARLALGGDYDKASCNTIKADVYWYLVRLAILSKGNLKVGSMTAGISSHKLGEMLRAHRLYKWFVSIKSRTSRGDMSKVLKEAHEMVSEFKQTQAAEENKKRTELP